jgi:hypothetical protein
MNINTIALTDILLSRRPTLEFSRAELRRIKAHALLGFSQQKR